MAKIRFFIFFQFFRKFVLTFVRIFDLAITYRPQMSIAQIDRLNETSPEMHSNRKSNGWSSVKNLHLYLRCTKYVARVRRGVLPWHRITLRVEDKTSCSTSHFDYKLFEINRFFHEFALKNDHFFKNFDFFIFFTFFEKCVKLFSGFRPRKNL